METKKSPVRKGAKIVASDPEPARNHIISWIIALPFRRGARKRQEQKHGGKEKAGSAVTTLKSDRPRPVDPATALYNARKWCTSSNPELSIIIVSRNNHDYILECIRQIWQNTEDITYEIIIVDNGSTGNNLSHLKDLGDGIRLIELNTDHFLGEANNMGAEYASSAYLCFTGGGVFVRKDSLNLMRRRLSEHRQIGAIAPMYLLGNMDLFMDHLLVDERGYTKKLHSNDMADRNPYSISQQVDYVSSAMMLVRRDDFVNVGGFDLRYEPAYYEDVDLCFKLRAIGLEIWYCAEAQLTFLEDFPTEEPSTNGQVLRDISRGKFVAKWALRSQFAATKDLQNLWARQGEQTTFTAANSSPAGAHPRMVGIITPYALTPGGGERVVLSLAAVLGDGDDVYLVTLYPYSHIRIKNLAAEFDVDVSKLRTLTYDQFKERHWDLAVVLGNEALPRFPPTGDRSVYICQFPFPGSPKTLKKRRKNIKGYERILTYSEFAKMHTNRALENYDHPPVEILYPPVPFIKGDASTKRKMILSVGRFFSGGNQKRHDLLIRAFRRLLFEGRIDADVELHLAGAAQPTDPAHMAYLSNLIQLAEGLPVKFHIDVPKGALYELYSSSAIYWHSAGYGADMNSEPGRAEHFGIAIVEAMSAECVPIAFGAGGPTEIITHGVDGFLFDTEDQLVNLTTELMSLKCTASRVEVGRAARITYKKFSYEQFRNNVLKYFR